MLQLIAVNSGQQCPVQRTQWDCVLAIAYWHGPKIQIHRTSHSSQLFIVDSIIIET